MSRFLLILGIFVLASQSPIPSFAHINESKIQEWTDKNENLKIQFAYDPVKPIIDTFTELKFSVQNLETGQHIKDFDARIVVTNGQRLFKFENITVSDGDFSVKYLFPDDGTHQVLTRINTNNAITLASFNVFVPHQAPPTLLNPFPKPIDGSYTMAQIISILLIILLPVVVIISIIFVIKKTKPK